MEENILDEFSAEKRKIIRRRSLLPSWIKIFTWIFMIFGVLIIPTFIFGALGNNIELELYGLETNRSLSFTGMLLLVLFLFKGLVAFSLWFEKSWAIIVGIIDATVGIFICTIVMLGISFISQHQTRFTFRFEILLLIPYLIKLKNINNKWRLE